MDRARSNLIRARQRLPNVYLEDLCFDAQQAAEKALKALCIERGIEFPYVHDLARLVTLLQDEGQPVPDAVREAGRLTRYAVLTRYPGLDDPVNEDDYERAVAIAERVVEWVEDRLDAGGETPDS
nr:HEPN domain-containing protein [Salinibacter ruber]